MPNVLVSTTNLTREQWLEFRRYGIGGSDIGTICGLNPYNSPYRLWLEKTGQIPLSDSDSEAMLWGRLHEDTIAKEFSRRTGIKVQRRNAILQHDEHAWALANVDRICIENGERGVLECKTTGASRADEWDGDDVPPAYMLQVQWYLYVTGYQFGYLACLIGGNKLVTRRVERDDDLIRELVERAAEFWGQVTTMTPPELDGSEATSDALSSLYPVATEDDPVELPLDALDLFSQYDAAKANAKEAETALEEWANKLKALMGPHAVGVCSERKVTWSTVTTQRLDTNKLKSERPEIFADYARPSVYRRFSVK